MTFPICKDSHKNDNSVQQVQRFHLRGEEKETINHVRNHVRRQIGIYRKVSRLFSTPVSHPQVSPLASSTSSESWSQPQWDESLCGYHTPSSGYSGLKEMQQATLASTSLS